MALEAKRLSNVIVMLLLESGSASGPLLDFYRDPDTNTASARRLFATDHPYNVFEAGVGTFNNVKTTTVADILSGKFFADTEEYFRGIKGPNGRPLGLTLEGGTCLIPPSRAYTFKRALTLDTVLRTISSAGALDQTANVVALESENNLWKGSIGYTVTDESSQSTVFYVRANDHGRGLYPWVIAKGAVEEIVNDKTSQRYKDTLKVSIAEILDMNAAAALPHAICKVTITG
jgi:hypothetical protein